MTKHFLILYFSTIVTIGVIDFLWLNIIAKDFYKDHLDELLEFHMVPAILFYLIYTVGIVIFANGSPTATWQSALLYGALFGFFAYATYDLSNMATLRGWSPWLAIVDITWGTLLTAMAATSGWFIADFFQKDKTFYNNVAAW